MARAAFTSIRHGSLERLLEILDSDQFDEQELRAALQNVIETVLRHQEKLDTLWRIT